MDVSILGSAIISEATKNFELGIFEVAVFLRKGESHGTCDDCVLVDITDKYGLLGVFDGVSGEENAQLASETALKTVKKYISDNFGNKEHKTLIERALEEANFAINKGGTTASIALVLPDGEYFYANVGDSHIYKRKEDIFKRITKDEKEATGSFVSEYLDTRHIMNNALGGILKGIDTGKGKLEKREMLLAMTDGIIDNLIIKIDAGVIADASGCEDLEKICKGNNNTASTVTAIANEIKNRFRNGDSFEEGKLLSVKIDDFAIAVVEYLG